LSLSRNEPGPGANRHRPLGERDGLIGQRYEWVQVFEKSGFRDGASNPHPHGQIWAGDALPREAMKEDATQRRTSMKPGGGS